MISPISFSEVFGGYQGINLGGGNIGMAQHGLNGTKIGTALQQMGARYVPEYGEIFRYRLAAVVTEDLQNLPTLPPVVHKDLGYRTPWQIFRPFEIFQQMG
jgi:hypothetical protein